MELSKRLQAVADLLDCHERIADIGCDHGFVSIYLVESKKASYCLAMDVNRGPLECAREHVIEKRLSTYIETRLSDGAKAIEFVSGEDGKLKLEVEAALIAGMGGRLTIQIIKDSLEKFKTMDEFVLQPQSEIGKVRQFVRSMGYHIERENMIFEDGKFYPMMKVVRGEKRIHYMDRMPAAVKKTVANEHVKMSDILWLFDEYGECLLKEKNQVLLQFLQKEKKLYGDILENLKKTDTLKSRLRQKEIREKQRYIELGLEWFEDEVQ